MTVHFHEHSRAILTMLEYAASAGDDEMMDFALRSFEWVRNLGVHPEGRASSVLAARRPRRPAGRLLSRVRQQRAVACVGAVQRRRHDRAGDPVLGAGAWRLLGRRRPMDTQHVRRGAAPDHRLDRPHHRGGRLQPASGRAAAHREHRRALVHRGLGSRAQPRSVRRLPRPERLVRQIRHRHPALLHRHLGADAVPVMEEHRAPGTPAGYG